MRTERQIEASRANGAKSRGPKTTDGKARSSQNSLRHGFLSKTLVLKTESKEAFHALFLTLGDVVKPRDAFEDELFFVMVAARWRSVRLWAIEGSGLDGEIEKLNQPTEPAARNAAKAFRNRSETTLPELIRRYDDGYDRQFGRAYKLLMQYRKDNQGYGPGLTAPLAPIEPDAPVQPVQHVPEPQSPPTHENSETNPSASPEPAQPAAPQPAKAAKVGRNQLCPCRSGLKFKRCCLNQAPSNAA